MALKHIAPLNYSIAEGWFSFRLGSPPPALRDRQNRSCGRIVAATRPPPLAARISMDRLGRTCLSMQALRNSRTSAPPCRVPGAG